MWSYGDGWERACFDEVCFSKYSLLLYFIQFFSTFACSTTICNSICVVSPGHYNYGKSMQNFFSNGSPFS